MVSLPRFPPSTMELRTLRRRRFFVRKDPDVDAVGFHDEAFDRIRFPAAQNAPALAMADENLRDSMFGGELKYHTDRILARQSLAVCARGGGFFETRIHHFPVFDVQSVLLDIQDVQIAVETIGLAASAL